MDARFLISRRCAPLLVAAALALALSSTGGAARQKPPARAGNLSVGAATTTAGAGYTFGVVTTLRRPGQALALRFYARGGSALQTFRPVVYATGAGGLPTHRVALGAPVAVQPGQAGSWLRGVLPQAHLGAGKYFLALYSGPADQGAVIATAEHPGHGIFSEDPQGPPSTLRAVKRSGDDLSLYLEYAAASATAPAAPSPRDVFRKPKPKPKAVPAVSQVDASVLRIDSTSSPGSNTDLEANPASGGLAPALYAYLERSPARYGWMTRDGEDTWVTLDLYFPSRTYTPVRGWFTLWGDKGWGGASYNSVAPWNIDGSDDRLTLDENSGAPNLHWDAAAERYASGALPEWGPAYSKNYDLGAITTDRWIALVIHFHWSHDKAHGTVQAWRDGKRYVSASTPTLAADDDRMRWPHQGAYRPGPPTNQNEVVFFETPMHIGKTLAAANASRPPLPAIARQVSDGASHITSTTSRAAGIPPPPAPPGGAGYAVGGT